MNRKFDISRYLTGYIAALFFGAAMSCFYWPLAKVMIVMFVLLWGLMRLQETPLVLVFRTLLLFVITLASFAGLVVNASPMTSEAFAINPLVLFGIAYYFQPKEFWEKDFVSLPFPWPKKIDAALALYAFVVLWFVIHTFFNLFLGKMAPPGNITPNMNWSKIFLLVTVFGLGYPARLVLPWKNWQRRVLQIGLPVAGVFILAGNYLLYHSIVTKVNNPYLPEYSAQEAFRRGFHGLGVQLAVEESIRLLETQGWPQANEYLRRQWYNTSKESFARQWRKHPQAQNNLFFFVTCFGASLQLKPGEETVDWVVDPEEQFIRVLTSQGRVLLINQSGITQSPGQELNAMAYAFHSSALHASIYNGHLEFGGDKFGRKILLPQDREWIDVAFRSGGESILLLDTHGRIMEVNVPQTETEWMGDIQPHELCPPLWGEQALAQSLLVLDDGTVLMADKVGAVHARGGNSRWDAKELSKHYHPERPIMRDLAKGRTPDELLLLDQNGWVYFIGSDTPTMQVLFDNDEAVGLAALPQINCLLQLKRSGRIVPYIMPQGAPVIFHGKGNRISTDP